MQEIRQKLNDALDLVTVKIGKYEEARKKADADAQTVAASEAHLNRLAEELAARERAVKAREQKVQQAEDLEAYATRITSAKLELTQAREVFARERDHGLKELADGRAALKAAQEKVAKAQAELDEDKRTYKKTIREEVIATMKAA